MAQALSNYFRGAATKSLAAVDCIGFGSNQHEVTGTSDLISILGDSPRRASRDGTDGRFDATYVYVGADDEVMSFDGKLSWYDSRENQAHRGPEWRLYYQENEVTRSMRPGDALFVLVLPSSRIGFVACSRESSFEELLQSLLGIRNTQSELFASTTIAAGAGSPADFLTFQVLDALGITPASPPGFDPHSVVSGFRGRFPSTADFSSLARSTLPDVDPRDDPDAALVAWIDREELLFRTLEREIVGAQLERGFIDESGTPDVDTFLKFSLSVQNRRKSRAGFALMNHFREILERFEIPFSAEATTEKKNAADFLFPGEAEYADPHFPAQRLRMVAAKTSCKGSLAPSPRGG